MLITLHSCTSICSCYCNGWLRWRLLALLLFLPIGAIIPVILYLISRKYPHSILNYIKWVHVICIRHIHWLRWNPLASRKYKIDFFPITFWLCCSLMVAGLGGIPPATAFNYVPWAIVGFVFQFIVRRWHFSFWAKYNCTQLHFTCIRQAADHVPWIRRIVSRSRWWHCYRCYASVFLVLIPHFDCSFSS